MMQQSLHANSLNKTMKKYVTITNPVNRSRKNKCYNSSQKLFGDSAFMTTLTIGLVFIMIQPINTSVVTSTYSRPLSMSNPKFARPGTNQGDDYYYYEAIQVTISLTDTYTFTSDSSIDTFGCLYSDSFNAMYPLQNLITYDDDTAGVSQFRLTATLQSGRRYILVVTTYARNTTGYFSIVATGSTSVGLASMTTVTTMFSDTLSSIDSMFTRPYGSSNNGYYYQATQVTVYTTGTYTFISNSSMHTYGYLYNIPFDPTNPLQNLIAYDDSSAGNKQFQIIRSLQSEYTYVLVLTTYYSWQTGHFSISINGPASVNLISFKPTSTPSPSTHDKSKSLSAVGIGIGSCILCIGLLSICAYGQKKNRTSTRRTTSSGCNRRTETQNVQLTNIRMDLQRGNVRYVPYTLPMPTAPVIDDEELPPSYEAYMSSLTPQQREDSSRY